MYVPMETKNKGNHMLKNENWFRLHTHLLLIGALAGTVR